MKRPEQGLMIELELISRSSRKVLPQEREREREKSTQTKKKETEEKVEPTCSRAHIVSALVA